MVFRMSLPSASEGLWTYHSTAKCESGLVWDFTEQLRGMGLFSTRVMLRFDLLTCSLVTVREEQRRMRRVGSLTEKRNSPGLRRTRESTPNCRHGYSCLGPTCTRPLRQRHLVVLVPNLLSFTPDSTPGSSHRGPHQKAAFSQFIL